VNHFKGGIKMKLSKICKEHGVNYRTVQTRLRRGWTLEDALNKPVQKHSTRREKLGGKENLIDYLDSLIDNSL
jgi:hypothetical protein